MELWFNCMSGKANQINDFGSSKGKKCPLMSQIYHNSQFKLPGKSCQYKQMVPRPPVLGS